MYGVIWFAPYVMLEIVPGGSWIQFPIAVTWVLIFATGAGLMSYGLTKGE